MVAGLEFEGVHGVFELVDGLSAKRPVARSVGVFVVVVVATGSAAVVHDG